ncbi:MAG: helix-turn-helix domain-containing protein [Candidatus Woesebacteria bacterium]|jgi:predicted DNA-binding transcriptional regulator AlpA
MKTQIKNIEFLKAILIEYQRIYQAVSELCPCDFIPSDDTLPKTDEKAERVAQLADENGFDGSLFRNSIPVDDPTSLQSMRRLTRKIETIPKIIAAIEKPPDRSIIPDDAELLTIPQVARITGWGESMVRQRDKEGLLPIPIRVGGTIQWNRQELKEWIKHGCPPRQKWELLKQGKGA